MRNINKLHKRQRSPAKEVLPKKPCQKRVSRSSRPGIVLTAPIIKQLPSIPSNALRIPCASSTHPSNILQTSLKHPLHIPQTSMFTALSAFTSIKLRRGSTSLPIRMESVRSASSAFSVVTRRSFLAAGSIPVSQS